MAISVLGFISSAASTGSASPQAVTTATPRPSASRPCRTAASKSAPRCGGPVGFAELPWRYNWRSRTWDVFIGFWWEFLGCWWDVHGMFQNFRRTFRDFPGCSSDVHGILMTCSWIFQDYHGIFMGLSESGKHLWLVQMGISMGCFHVSWNFIDGSCDSPWDLW